MHTVLIHLSNTMHVQLHMTLFRQPFQRETCQITKGVFYLGSEFAKNVAGETEPSAATEVERTVKGPAVGQCVSHITAYRELLLATGLVPRLLGLVARPGTEDCDPAGEQALRTLSS